MGSPLILEGIQFSGHCGVSLEERSQPQPILVDLEVDCNNDRSTETDRIHDTIDYADIVNRVIEIGTQHHFCLVEALAERITQTLLDEFPVLALKIWLRKTTPPLTAPVDSVGIRLHRVRPIHPNTLVSVGSAEQPASFLMEHHHHIPKGTILDLATGHGRNALYLASHGYSVVGVDKDTEALQFLDQKAKEQQLSNLTTWQQDLEENSVDSLNLGKHTYDGIVVFFYLHRPLFPALIHALKPGGVLVYETFLIDNHHIHGHPRRQEFCLQHNELLQLINPLRIMYYAEGVHETPTSKRSAYTARVLALKEEPLSKPYGTN